PAGSPAPARLALTAGPSTYVISGERRPAGTSAAPGARSTSERAYRTRAADPSRHRPAARGSDGAVAPVARPSHASLGSRTATRRTESPPPAPQARGGPHTGRDRARHSAPRRRLHPRRRPVV